MLRYRKWFREQTPSSLTRFTDYNDFYTVSTTVRRIMLSTTEAYVKPAGRSRQLPARGYLRLQVVQDRV